jgi:hypothetical protein
MGFPRPKSVIAEAVVAAHATAAIAPQNKNLRSAAMMSACSFPRGCAEEDRVEIELPAQGKIAVRQNWQRSLRHHSASGRPRPAGRDCRRADPVAVRMRSLSSTGGAWAKRFHEWNFAL